MTEHETPKDLKAFSEEASPRVVELLDTSQLPLPRPVHQRAKKAAKGFTFTRDVKLGELTSVVAFLTAYRQFERLNDIAREVAPTPYTGNETLYESIREIVHTASYTAQRRGDSETIEALTPYVIVPSHFMRPPSYLNGETLRNWLEMPADEVAMYSQHPVSYQAGIIVIDLVVLASISVCGGSATWTPERIDAQVDKNIAGLYAVPGYAPSLQRFNVAS